MAYLRRTEHALSEALPTEAPPTNGAPLAQPGLLSNQAGIVLFMVMGTIALMSIVVTEMAYLSTVSKRIAYDALDQVQAHAMAENGLKIGLLRLKAYQSIKKFVNAQTQGNAAAASMVPRAMIEQIWSMPFRYPIPKDLPGLSLGDKEAIAKFKQASALEGTYNSAIVSESGKLNLNLLLASYVPKAPTNPTPGASPSPTPSPSPSAATFDPQSAREGLFQFLQPILQNKMETDTDFAEDYRDFRLEEFVDAVAGWADKTYQPRIRNLGDGPPLKKAPFYSVTELRMLPRDSGFDDTLYDLFAPNLTASTTPGVNVNTMEEPTLRALLPRMTKEEGENFFKFRDDPQADNHFKDKGAFTQWIQANVAAFRNDAAEVQRWEMDLTKRGVRLVVDETLFRIMASSEVNRAKKAIEAWVTLLPPASPTNPAGGAAPPLGANPGGVPGAPPKPDPGIRITFMRIL